MKLPEAVETYVKYNQGLGYEYTSSTKVLRRFAKSVGNIEISELRGYHVSAFLRRARISNNTWRFYRSHVHRFVVYWSAHRKINRRLDLEQKPSELRTFSPYIYTRTEIRRLLATTAVSQRFPRCVLDETTFRALILFLYGTGLSIGDALRLRVSDIDFRKNTLRIRASAEYLKRTVPMGEEIASILKRLIRDRRSQPIPDCDAVFVSTKGKPLRYEVVRYAFRQLRQVARIRRSNGSYQPRLQDLRHTFAVHSIAKWIRRKWDMNQMLPRLSVYMGYVEFHTVNRYRELSPENYLEQLGRLK